MNSFSQSYKDSGVDITAGYKAVELMKASVARTLTPGVVGGLGGFGGLFRPDLTDMKKPILVSGTDGVGTKLKIAFLLDKHDTIGIDCVAMCVNDVLCSGARPLFFLDYLAIGYNRPEKVAAIVSGVAEGCVQANCALIGGETAEMPGLYGPDEYDLAGFAVGLVDEDAILDPNAVKKGDVLIGLASSGIHSNGYSLVRRIFNVDDQAANRLNIMVDELGETLGENLLRPTRIYVRAIDSLLAEVPVKAISHITGGGFYENIPRMLPNGCSAKIQKGALPVLPIFQLMQRTAHLEEREMYNVFNMGVGLMLVVAPEYADQTLRLLTAQDETATVIGEIVAGSPGEKSVVLW
ncbi:MAG TPA: phosphoribosylformylglycinamidine cyclo-ligase [Clostridiales bacterium]|jgi:phosphoribosylformylglycinamidine cyclo-ligase|nr:phosphoribosylformylglycinamidine cyclo-ligase [Clostridiales bacterium]